MSSNQEKKYRNREDIHHSPRSHAAFSALREAIESMDFRARMRSRRDEFRAARSADFALAGVLLLGQRKTDMVF